ncbi:MAG TPA: hypothetical protein VJZ76_08970 [Thermoanaerobaculia bacterium]|nr:hypothetical protein [Thermoanaerobaculia bacterium]
MSDTAILLVVISGLILAGAVLQRAERQWIRGVGFLTTALGYIFAVSATWVDPRWWVFALDVVLIALTIAILRTTPSSPSG